MNVVGRVGSLISQGVYSVATPFHPFGGAVDIIVVEQQDGTYRSTPWYVRFGKFQGVLKGPEKLVGISVNGVEANFHMYLDNAGVAYFSREVTSGAGDEESNDQLAGQSFAAESSQGDYFDKLDHDRQNSYVEGKEEVENEEYGHEDDRSPQDNAAASLGHNNYHYGSLDEVESMVESSEDAASEMVLVSVDGHVLTAPISSNEEHTDNVQLTTPQFHLGPGEGSSEDFCADGVSWEAGLFGDMDASSLPKDIDTSTQQAEGFKEVLGLSVFEQEARVIANVDAGGSSQDDAKMTKDDTFKSCLDFNLMSPVEEGDSQDQVSPSGRLQTNGEIEHLPSVSDKPPGDAVAEDSSIMTCTFATSAGFDHPCKDILHPRSIEVKSSETEVIIESNEKGEQLGDQVLVSNSDLSGSDVSLDKSGETKAIKEMTSDVRNLVKEASSDSALHSVCHHLHEKNEHMENVPGNSVSIEEGQKPEVRGSERNIRALGFEISMCGNLLRPGIGRNSAEEAFDAHRITEEEFRSSGASIVKNGNLIVRCKDLYLPWDKAAPIVLGMAVFGSDFFIDPKDSIFVEHEETAKGSQDTNAIPASPSRRWRLWPNPFRRVGTLQPSNSSSSNEELFVDSESGLQSPRSEGSVSSKISQSPHKQFVRSKIPTTEQIASLNLKDGKNIITFSFSTRVLGKQQVDAHIYLWKWNARIVISDVDGTITKSDVLGQFMPLVGKDWTQSGVARLFSAIKENGYQLLFLSARAIVQAYLTRSFLLNLKQDGKALPNGPVVISPDGLFPSLYREVVRRAPHEFKIACLEDIRALFPSDYNPFYAGFGNRDTDELSYRKIGIPKGKIFIINPRGEVAINHCIDVKSYTSLHTLVNDMFPPTSLVEEEDFNSWNYWKVPLPNLDS